MFSLLVVANTTNKSFVKLFPKYGMGYRFMTQALHPQQTLEMFDWLDLHKETVESVEHSPLESILEMIEQYSHCLGMLDGPWVVVLNCSDDDAVFFKLKWC